MHAEGKRAGSTCCIISRHGCILYYTHRDNEQVERAGLLIEGTLDWPDLFVRVIELWSVLLSPHLAPAGVSL
jgi:hypothetical protein